MSFDAYSVYLDDQARMIEIVQTLGPVALNTVVPACPAWTVQDLLAHVTAGVVDSVAGNVPELAGVNLMDHWKDAAAHGALEELVSRQIRERQGRSVSDLLAEWRAATEQAAPMLRGERSFPPGVPPLMEWTIAMDVTVHDDDLRCALGREPADPTLPCFVHATTWYGMSLDIRIRDLERPAMRLEAEDVALDLGEGAPVAILRAGAYEMTMALTGRRSEEEIRALDWDGDPSPFLDVFSAYATPS
jgi:uncharacterized protein (TIGR03083 family)